MVDESPAKVWSDQRDLPIYLGDAGDGFRLPFKERWRLPDACAALVGFVVTGSAVTVNLDSGRALLILVTGVVLTAAAVSLLSRLPASRPSIRTRAEWFLADLAPRSSCSHPAKDAAPR